MPDNINPPGRGRSAQLPSKDRPGHRTRGRRSRLTPAVVSAICDALEAGAYGDEAAALAGVSRSTYYSWLRQGRDARERRDLGHAVPPADQVFLDFLESVERAETIPEMKALKRVHRAAQDGSWRAAAWFLERRYPHRWGPGRRNDPDEAIHRESSTPYKEVSAQHLEQRILTLLGTRSATTTQSYPGTNVSGTLGQ